MHLDTSVALPAAPAVVWALIGDAARHADWNPRLRFEGAFTEGARLPMRLRLAGVPLRVRVRIVTLAPHRELAWEGGLPGVFVGRHHLRLTPVDGGTRLDHGETFVGVAVPVLGPALRPALLALYDDVNRALAATLAR